MGNPDHEKNRAMWNEIVDIHMKHPEYRVKEFLEGQSTLKDLERQYLGDFRGKTLLHLMCQFGLDTLSLAREGAIVTGVDISDQSISGANALKLRSRLPARFIRCDVLDLENELNEQFDIVYQSYGTLCWLADLRDWAKVVSNSLKPGGHFLLIDSHPVHDLFAEPDLNYFIRDACYYHEIPDYCDRNYVRKNVSAEWIHTIAEILTSLIEAGLSIQTYQEYDYGFYAESADWYVEAGRWYPPTGPSRHPLMMLVRAVKP